MRRAVAIGALLAVATSASANYSMAPALSMFTEAGVLIYVFVVLGIETWIIGKNIDQSWGRLIFTCVAANFFTAIWGFIGVPNIKSVLIGGPINPNPLLSAIFGLTIFALFSGPIESLAWMTIRREMPKWKVFANTMLAHAIGIPLGLLGLLLPARPYEGLEFYVSKARQATRSGIMIDLYDRIAADGRVPDANTSPELFEMLARTSKRKPRTDDWIAAAHSEVAERFDSSVVGEPFELNRELAGKPMADIKSQIWILRRRSPEVMGYIINPSRQRVVATHKPSDLGYTHRPDD